MRHIEAISRSSSYHEGAFKPIEGRDERYGARNADHYQRTRDYPVQRRTHNQGHYHPYKRQDRNSTEDRGSHHYSSYIQRQQQPSLSHASGARDLVYRPVNRKHSEQHERAPTYVDKSPVTIRAPREITNANLSHSKSEINSSDRGVPLRRETPVIPREAIVEAMGEVRDVMKQYASCVDPSESAARKECCRRAEELRKIEETALRMVQASKTTPPDPSQI